MKNLAKFMIAIITTSRAFKLTALITAFLCLIILGFSAHTRGTKSGTMKREAIVGRITDGGAAYLNHCADCHGSEGWSYDCQKPEGGERTKCIGPLLNGVIFRCDYLNSGEPLPPLEQYIVSQLKNPSLETAPAHQTVSLLTNKEKLTAAATIAGWHQRALVTCWPTPEPIISVELPVGDLAKGETLYYIRYGCSACHGDLEDPNSAVVGPWLGMMQANNYEPPVEGYSKADYLYESIVQPSAYIPLECPTGPCTGPPSSMPGNLGIRMTLQDLADVMAFVLQSEGSLKIEQSGPFYVEPKSQMPFQIEND